MKLHSLTLLLFISCNCIGSHNQSNVELFDTADNVRETITNSSNLISRKFENDTTIIPLKKLNVNLLDVRIDCTDKRELSVLRGNVVTEKIEIPTQETILGFAVNWIIATEKGFELSIEYGGSSRYYHKVFRFYFENNDFVLKDILIDAFDKRDPEDEKSYIKRIDTLKVPIKFKDFKIVDYL